MNRNIGPAISLPFLVAILIALSPATAVSAKYVSDLTPPSGPYSITVDDSADANNAGTSLRWRAKITCPKGEPFTVGGQIRAQATALPVRYAEWEAWPTVASGEVTGTCRGRSQTIRLTFAVGPTTLISPAGAMTEVFVPISPAPAALVAQLHLSTPNSPDRGSPYYCSYAPCPARTALCARRPRRLGRSFASPEPATRRTVMRKALNHRVSGPWLRYRPRPKEILMSSVARVTTISARSETSFEDAISIGVARAAETIRNIEGAWVKDQTVSVSDGKITVWQVVLEVTFVLE